MAVLSDNPPPDGSPRTAAPPSPSGRYIAGVLAERIQQGEYKGGQWFPSERALTEEFSVSRVVIRSAIRELEERGLVLSTARCRRLVSTAPPAAVNRETAASGARRSLAVWLWPEPRSGSSHALLRGIRQALNQDDFRLVLESPHGETWDAVQQSEQQFLQRIIRDRDIEGILLWHVGGAAQMDDLQAVRAAGIAMVFLDRLPPCGFDADYVGVDNRHAAQQVMHYLLSQGHRRIAYVTNLDTASPVQERQAGYREALEQARLTYDPRLVAQDDGVLGDEQGCARVVEQLVSQAEPPTAIFAVNDVTAFRVITALRTSGLQIPKDIAVVGFDGIERWSPRKPFLTTINQPFERIGERAAEILLQRLETGPATPFKHIVLDAPMVLHDSS